MRADGHPRVAKGARRTAGARDALERELGRVIPWVFPRDNGKPIKTLQDDWKAACKAAGIPMTIQQTPDVVRTSLKWKKTWKATGRREVPARIPHDFRRTAVRN